MLQPGHKWMYWGRNILFSSFLVVLKNGTGTFFLQKNVSVAWCVSLKSLSVKSKSHSYEARKILQVANELCQESYFKLCFSGIFTMQQPGITVTAWVRCQLLW